VGSTVGEELLSLSLAPGEEVVIEQKTFSKKETTYEDQNETDQEIDLQFEATLTTGLDEGLDQQRNRNSRTDVGLNPSVTIPVEGVDIHVAGSLSSSVTDSDTNSRHLAVKRSQASSSKVASKYRSQHKTTLRISSEQTFETTSKRTLRNPNRYTPLDLRYFKIYQSVELHHERYGVRLAWAPCIPSPGAATLGRANDAYQQVIYNAQASVELPSKPQPPLGLSPQTVNSDSKTVKADNISGGRTTVALTASPPSNVYVWDGDADFISNSLQYATAGVEGTPSVYVDGLPWTSSDGTLNIPVHVGWSGGQVTVSTAAKFIASSGVVSQQMADYQQNLSDYNSKVAALMAAARATAEPDAQAARDAVLADTDPLAECFRQALTTYVSADNRQDCWQFDVWRTLFDWSLANVTLYPAWWSDTVPDKTRPLTDFVNAVEARVYLPIKPMMEQMAINLIVAVTRGLTPNATQVFQDFADYRQQIFGDPLETPIDSSGGGSCPTLSDNFVCLASWTDLLPTEGTHLEVVQGSTAAEDDLNQAQLADAATMRSAQIQGTQATTTLNQSIDTGLQSGKTPVTVNLVEGSLNNGSNTGQPQA
jgi:hypothetical protein